MNSHRLYRSANDRILWGGDPAGFQAAYTPPVASTGGAPAQGDISRTQAGPADSSTPGGTPGDTPDAAPGTAAPGPSQTTATGFGAAPFSQSAPTDWRSQRRQERWQYRAESRGVGAISFGLLLIILGGAFAWNQIDPRFNLSLAWPIAIMAVGAILIVSSVGPSRHD